MPTKKKQYDDITKAINEIADYVNDVLDKKRRQHYFEGIVLLYSFVENLLKWLVCIKILWDKAQDKLHGQEVKTIRQFCKRMNFYTASQVALSIRLIDLKLYKRIDDLRSERNDIIHQFWLYSHRTNRLVLRKKLEKSANTANMLVGIFNSLTEDIGLDEVYELFL